MESTSSKQRRSCVVTTLQGKVLHVDLTVGELAGYEGHPDAVLHAYEDLDGELRPVDLRLGDITEGEFES